MHPVAFQPFLYLHLPPTGENTRQLNYRTSILHAVYTIIERTTYNGVVYGNFDKKTLDIATNLNNNKLLLV